MLMRASINHWITEQFGEQAWGKQPERGFERWGERGGRTGRRDSLSKGERWEWRGAPGAGERGSHEHGPAERGRGGRGRGEFGIGPGWYPMGYTSAFIFYTDNGIKYGFKSSTAMEAYRTTHSTGRG